MSEPSLIVESHLPVAFEPVAPTAAMARGSLLLLRVVNLYEGGHDAESNRQQERVEAKLDLMLHWLAATLFAAGDVPTRQAVRLDAGGVEWPADPNLTPGAGCLRLYPHPAIEAPLGLAVRVTRLADGWARAEFDGLDEALLEQWTQWLFRLHRRAIQSERR